MRIQGMWTTVAVIGAMVSGCSSETGQGIARSEQLTAPEESTGRVLATVQGDTGTTIIFREVSPGRIMTEEMGPMSAAPLLDGVHAATVLDAYKALAHGAEPPTELKAAEARRLQLMAPGESGAIAPATEGGDKTIGTPRAVPMLTSNQTWFQNTFCKGSGSVGVQDCQFGQSFAATGPSYSYNFQAKGMNDATASAAASLAYKQWNGSSFVPIWISGPVNPGYWNSMIWWTSSPTWAEAAMQGAGAVGVASYIIDPSVSGAYYYNNQVQITGSNWLNDTEVLIQLNGSDSNGTVGYAVVTNGSFSTTYVPWCVSYPQNKPVTITAKGANTSQSWTSTVILSNCW